MRFPGGGAIDSGGLVSQVKGILDAKKARDQAEWALSSRAPTQPLPSWAPQAPGQPPSQAPSQGRYAPPQLALGAPMGQVSPARVTNQALSNALRAPPAPQAVGGNNG